MSLNILRWEGGFGGDLLMKLISGSSAVRTNTKFQDGLSDQGKILLDFSHLNLDRLKQIDCIAAQEFFSKINAALLKQELDELVAGDQPWWVKSHYYAQDFYTDHIIDIVADQEYLPFAVSANISKTNTIHSDFNLLVSKITNPHVRYQYSIYSVAKDFVRPCTTTRTIQIKQLFSGWEQLKQTLKIFDVTLDDELENTYDNWLNANIKYLPSSTYQYLAQTQDYNIDHPKITLIERYCLLVLSGRKFRLLDKNEV